MVQVRARVVMALAILAITVAPTLLAQPHSLGYVCGGNGGRLYVVDGLGVTKQARIASQPLYGLTMNAENRTVIVTHLSGELLRVDPETFTILGTIYAGAPLVAVRDITIDHNGDYFVTDSGANAIFRITPAGAISTVMVDNNRLTSPLGGLRIDVDTGDLLVLDIAGDDSLLRVKRDGSAMTTVGNGFNGRHGFAQHIPSAEIYAGSGGGLSGSIQVLSPRASQAAPFVNFTGPSEMLALAMDRSSALEQRMIGTGSGVTGGIWMIDYVTKVATSLTLFHQNAYEVDFLYGRNLQSVRTGNGRWELQASFPDSPARQFAVLASLAGTRPAMLTPGGLAVNIALDPLFFQTLSGGAAPFITGNHGLLDLAGAARVQIDVSSLGAAANGHRVWFCAIVLDPAAPYGIKTVSDPYLIVFEGL